MYRSVPLLPCAAIGLAACMPATTVPEPLPFFGGGYRAEGDVCRRVGETEFTNRFLDDAADLVGCPADAENLGVFVTETNARLVARYGGTNLYSVPLR